MLENDNGDYDSLINRIDKDKDGNYAIIEEDLIIDLRTYGFKKFFNSVSKDKQPEVKDFVDTIQFKSKKETRDLPAVKELTAMYFLARKIDMFEKKQIEFDVSLFETKQIAGLTEEFKLPFKFSQAL